MKIEEGTDFWDNIVVELEYDLSCFFTCDVDIEEYVSGSVSAKESAGRVLRCRDRGLKRREEMDIREHLLLNLFLFVFSFTHCNQLYICV
jgi:hypothetical protein